MINWRVRIKNRLFWLSIIPAVILLIEQLLALFGVHLDLKDVQEQLLALVGTVFAILSILGVITDPTTAGLEDSAQAMSYEEPKK